MEYVCAHCGILSRTEVTIKCPICGKETLEWKPSQAGLGGQWVCRDDGPIEEVPGVEFDNPIMICKKCGRDEVRIEI